EGDVINLLNADFAFPQTIFDREFWKAGIMFFAGKPLLLRRRQDLPVADQAGRTVMIKCRYAEDVKLVLISCLFTVGAGIHLLKLEQYLIDQNGKMQGFLKENFSLSSCV